MNAKTEMKPGNRRRVVPKSNRAACKVLLVYANTPMEPLMPLGIATLATALENAECVVRLFDTTYYQSPNAAADSQAARAATGQVKPVDYAQVGIHPRVGDPVVDFVRLVKEFKPQLIGLSCVELTWEQGRRLLESVRGLGIPTIVGGCFASFSPREVLANDCADLVCVGEGEGTLVELARRLAAGQSLDNIPNLWRKSGGRVVPASTLSVCPVASLPVPRFTVFDPARIHRAMDGTIYRMLPVEFSRGCPYQCTYCSAPSYAKQFQGAGPWLRFKPVAQIIKEIDYHVRTCQPEYFYFIAETFLALPPAQRAEFYRQYKRYRIPFWFNTRPETVTEEDVRQLEAVGCHRISVGIESGNERFRRTMLKRNYTNAQALQALRLIRKSKIQLSVNNMIGFPDETRELFFDTIEFNRQFQADSHTLSIFQPFRGTALYDYCVAKGYWDPRRLCSESFATPGLTMPTMSKEEISGLYRMWHSYLTTDKSRWPELAMAEPGGNA